jgi:subtilisin family serine protease
MRRARWCYPLLALVAVLLSTLPLAPAVLAAPGPPDAPQWWVDRWQVHDLWSSGTDGRGVTIGEIDSGVNAQLPELASKILVGKDFGAAGGNGRIDREADPFGHGTAMASIMVASSGLFGIEGLAPGARILPIAIPLPGTTDADDGNHLADAIRWAADHGSKVINMSLAGKRDPDSNPLACPVEEQSAIFYAIAKGAVLVAASGNNGPAKNDVEQPSVCIGVLTVGATDSAGVVANFSSRHPYTTVTAPGVDIASLGRIAGQAYSGMGTSQAAALTSAAIALIWSKFPKLTNQQVVARLLATLDKPRSSPDPAYGYGQINPASAIRNNVPASAPNVVYSAAQPFLTQITAAAKPAVPAPPKRALAEGPPGQFSADKPPSDVTDEVRIAASVAAAGLLALLLLIAFAGRGRRRRRVDRLVLTPTWASTATGSDPALPWHDVFEPPSWAAPVKPPQWAAPPGPPTVIYPPLTLMQGAPPPAPEWLPPTSASVSLPPPDSAGFGDPVHGTEDGPQ